MFSKTSELQKYFLKINDIFFGQRIKHEQQGNELDHGYGFILLLIFSYFIRKRNLTLLIILYHIFSNKRRFAIHHICAHLPNKAFNLVTWRNT